MDSDLLLLPVVGKSKMKIMEYTCGLFPNRYYIFPDGEFSIRLSSKIYHLSSGQLVLLQKHLFELTTILNKYYSDIKKGIYFKQRFPYNENKLGILIYYKYFEEYTKEYFKSDNKNKKLVLGLGMDSSYYCVYLKQEHEYDELSYDQPIKYINQIRDKDGMEALERKYFAVIREFFNYVTILRAPYINLTDINYLYIKHVYDFFCDESNNQITEVKPLRFDFWEPKDDELAKRVKDFFDKHNNIPIEDLFLAKAKIYVRLQNKSMAIIHAAIALEVVVPDYINKYLKTHGVDSEAIQDFNHKFGLSVRVKALLKIMLPANMHELISRVGTIIKYRNRIMHEGKTNEYFEDINIEELICACEVLIERLKQ